MSALVQKLVGRIGAEGAIRHSLTSPCDRLCRNLRPSILRVTIIRYRAQDSTGYIDVGAMSGGLRLWLNPPYELDRSISNSSQPTDFRWRSNSKGDEAPIVNLTPE